MSNLILSRGRVRHLKNQNTFHFFYNSPISKLVFGINVPTLCFKAKSFSKTLLGKTFQTCVSNMHSAFMYACLGYAVNNMKHIYFYTSISCISAFICTKTHRASIYLNTYQIADYHIINVAIYRFYSRSSH